MKDLKRHYSRPDSELIDIRIESICISGNGNEDVSKESPLNDDDFE